MARAVRGRNIRGVATTTPPPKTIVGQLSLTSSAGLAISLAI